MSRTIPYMFCIAFSGIFMLVLMRKKFIIDYRLHFPSGTATGILITGLHTPKGETQAHQQASRCSLVPFASSAPLTSVLLTLDTRELCLDATLPTDACIMSC